MISITNSGTQSGGDLLGKSVDGYYSLDRLRDGRSIVIRQVRPDEKSILIDVISHLSRDSRYFRYLSPRDGPSNDELAGFTKCSPDKHFALVACLREGTDGALGIAEYYVESNAERAELAFAVKEEFHGCGIATDLLRHLKSVAAAAGIGKLFALVHPSNSPMLHVLLREGFEQVCSGPTNLELELVISSKVD